MTSTPREVPSNFSAVIAPVVMALISRVVQRSRMCSSSGLTTRIPQTVYCYFRAYLFFYFLVFLFYTF